MKKIMFNDRYGLTQAVLDGRKTMTRRIATELNHPNITDISEWGVDNDGYVMLLITYDTWLQKDVYPHFQIGEEVAVAQPYKDIYPNADFKMVGDEFMTETAGWNNKMFVKANLMLHSIRITDIKLERLQDISEDDCMKEGIFKSSCCMPYCYHDGEGITKCYPTPIDAFFVLIDRISGKGTWERNPWVYAYEFELIK